MFRLSPFLILFMLFSPPANACDLDCLLDSAESRLDDVSDDLETSALKLAAAVSAADIYVPNTKNPWHVTLTATNANGRSDTFAVGGSFGYSFQSGFSIHAGGGVDISGNYGLGKVGISYSW